MTDETAADRSQAVPAPLCSPASRGFVLHERLQADTIPIGRLALSRLLLMNDATYPWLILVPQRPDVHEIIDLAAADRATLMEIVEISRALAAMLHPDKLNVAAGDRQPRSATACPCCRPLPQRPGMASADLGAHASASLQPGGWRGDARAVVSAPAVGAAGRLTHPRQLGWPRCRG